MINSFVPVGDDIIHGEGARTQAVKAFGKHRTHIGLYALTTFRKEVISISPSGLPVAYFYPARQSFLPTDPRLQYLLATSLHPRGPAIHLP